MAIYKRKRVVIVIEEGSDIDRRVAAYAKLRGVSYNQALQESVDVGVYPHMRCNLDLLERIHRENRAKP